MIVVLDVGSSSLRSSLWERDGSSLGEKARIEQAGTGELEAALLLGRVAARPPAPPGGPRRHRRRDLDLLALPPRARRRGPPSTPVYSWADARAASFAAELRERLDEAAFHARTGCGLHSATARPGSPGSATPEPDTFAAAAASHPASTSTSASSAKTPLQHLDGLGDRALR